MMAIGLAADSLLEPYGNGRYARELVGALLQSEAATSLEWHLIGYRDRSLSPVLADLGKHPRASVSVATLPPKRLVRLVSLFTPLPLGGMIPPLHLLHLLRPTDAVRVAGRTRLLVTLHDLGFLEWPHPEPWYHQFLESAAFRLMRRRADLVVTVSDATRVAAISRLHLDPERVVTIHSGIAEDFFRPVSTEEGQNIRAKYRLPSHYLITVGHNSPRKNVSRLLRAHHLLTSSYPDAPPLVLVGAQPDTLDTGLGKAIVTLGYVPTTDLPALLSAATMCVFPSLYEGFGFPALEAQATGTPVAASDIPVFRELLGDSAAYFDPRSVEDIAATLGALLDDGARRDRLRGAGQRNAERFHWSAVADKYMQVYCGQVEPPGRRSMLLEISGRGEAQ